MSSGAVTGRLAAVRGWLDDPEHPDWRRPGPTLRQQRHDLAGAAVVAVAAVAFALLSRGWVIIGEPLWVTVLVALLIPSVLTVRRRFPLAVVTAATVFFTAGQYWAPGNVSQPAYQASFFVALYTAVAWGRDRRRTWLVMALVVSVTWGMVIHLLVSYGMDLPPEVLEAAGVEVDELLLPVGLARAIYELAIVAAYLGTAILVGRTAWRAALRRHRLALQAEQITEQSVELASRAVTAERMRIARDLHDSVAHHVSVIGVQAGAARRVIDRHPGAAADALRAIEGTSRTAVEEMRAMLGVLRADEPGVDGSAVRMPSPGLSQLEILIEGYRDASLDVRLHLDLGEQPESISPQLGRTIYRIVQESLANTSRHSTAATCEVRVELRHDHGEGHGQGSEVEVEVLDDGRPVERPDGETPGSGFGLRGIRERVALHGGRVQIGPHTGGQGWRVQARLPLGSTVTGA